MPDNPTTQSLQPLVAVSYFVDDLTVIIKAVGYLRGPVAGIHAPSNEWHALSRDTGIPLKRMDKVLGYLTTLNVLTEHPVRGLGTFYYRAAPA